MVMNTWRKSSHSGSQGDACVELAALPHGIAVRDSKDPHGPQLILDQTAFHSLVERLRRQQ